MGDSVENRKADQVLPQVWRDMFMLVLVAIMLFWTASFFELSEKFSKVTSTMETWQLDEVPLVLLALFIIVVAVLSRRTSQLRVQTELQVQAQRDLAAALIQNKRLARRNIEVQENERRNLARELHDEFGQSLNAIMIDGVGIRDTTRDDSDAHKHAQSILRISGQLFSGMRDLLKQLRPLALDELGLQPALEHLVDDWRRRYPKVEWLSEFELEDNQFDEPSNMTIYRFIQEGMTNIVKHSDASLVKLSVNLDARSSRVTMSVSDNGSIITFPQRSEGIGLLGLRERLESLGGQFESSVNRPTGFKIEGYFDV
ncbi:MAG: histidine kinase [Betaproteobacteria bacterium]